MIHQMDPLLDADTILTANVKMRLVLWLLGQLAPVKGYEQPPLPPPLSLLSCSQSDVGVFEFHHTVLISPAL